MAVTRTAPAGVAMIQARMIVGMRNAEVPE